MSFSSDEIAYLQSQPLARVATLGPEGQPEVVPIALEYDGTHLWFGGGPTFAGTRKCRNVVAGRQKVAVVLDDMPSFDPFVARGIRIYGDADGPHERVGMVGPGTYIRVTPTISWSWNLDGQPVGDTWYESRRTVH